MTVPAESVKAHKLQLHPAKLQVEALVVDISPDMDNTSSKNYKLDVVQFPVP